MTPLALHDPIVEKIPHRIVLTGGPCGGKSTVMEFLQETFKGRVAFMTEIASMLLNNGYPRPAAGTNSSGMTEWIDYLNRVILPTQVNMENSVLHGANSAGLQTIIFDRGLNDIAAYCGGFEGLKAAYGVDLEQSWDRYTMVIHLESLACLGDEAYLRMQGTNSARYDTPEIARLRDKQLVDVWNRHPNWHHISAAGGMDAVKSRVLDLLSPILDVEVERKWVVDWKALSPILGLDLDTLRYSLICQHYLVEGGSTAEMRIRKMDSSAYLTIKSGTGKARKEWNTEMPMSVYEAVRITLPYCAPVIEKTRYYLPDDDGWLELDMYSKPHGGLVLLEREFRSESAADSYVLPPAWLPHVREVTEDLNYKNQRLAHMDVYSPPFK